MVIALTAAGRRVALIETLRSDAESLGVNLRVLALDSRPELSSACHVADDFEGVPSCESPVYLRHLEETCSRNLVSLIIPTSDFDLLKLAKGSGAFAKHGIAVAISKSEAVSLARDKLNTAQILKKNGIRVPQTHLLRLAEINREGIVYPCILKPRSGSNSQGIIRAQDWSQVPKGLDGDDYVIQEEIKGPEYTVNCYVDSGGVLRSAVPHRRIEVRGGEVSKAVTERRDDLRQMAKAIVSAVDGLRGPFCFQVIISKQGPVVFEINARFGGGYPLAHAAGATFGKWLMEEALGLPSTANDEWEDGLLMLRYDSAVYTKTKPAP